MRGKTMTDEETNFCFVTCVNDEHMYKLCLEHIQSLFLPPGVQLEVVAIRGATSITSGYNQAARNSKAKYKVYLHQDTYIMNRNFLYELLRVFQNHPQLGLVGLIGSGTIPANGVWWESGELFGKVLEYRSTYNYLKFAEAEGPFKNAAAIDGLLMATQYDIPWRDDIFDGWHFYDISQSCEFKRKGYSVGILPQAEPWALHACGVMYPDDIYYRYRDKFLQEYSSDATTFGPNKPF
ncbi:glycosyltransferase family protein [Paenibacillus sp. P96]|uniref:Glycosyltransferase family protein n=1 Tax=Paenibacillus zeirhizosphaerae TaxID=2987519 RepID=A0ABT9FNW9_9BACL|nr:glycosyltransferase family protein [Paenibacillus sp. P96]MDP4096421.1 glycosyltransferase family protein [Paenibacillus sp. P96]